jgi:hypothetical protein
MPKFQDRERSQVLLGQHRADQLDDRVPAGKYADDVGSPADLLVQSLFIWPR